VLCGDGRIVTPLLTGIPVRCTRLRRGWRLPPHHSEGVVGGPLRLPECQERLAEIIPLLIGSLRGGTAAA